MFKKVFIINDLPIMYAFLPKERTDNLEKQLVDILAGRNSSTSYQVIASERMERWIKKYNPMGKREVIVIGGGPQKIVQRYRKDNFLEYMFLSIKRIRDKNGNTIGYDVDAAELEKISRLKEKTEGEYLNFFEDVIFTGGTIEYILNRLEVTDRRERKYRIDCFFAAERSVKKIINLVPNRIEVAAEYMVEGRPLKDWVVFLMSDLMFGDVDGIRYFDIENWMEDSFGENFENVKKIILDEVKWMEDYLK